MAGRDWEERKERKLVRMRKEGGGGKGGKKDLNTFKFLQKDTINLVFNI